jgi:hypothetical protein
MRTTISIDDAVLEEAKVVAARTGRTLGAVIEDALREVFARRHEAQPRRAIELPVSNLGGGLRPGVNLDSNAELLDLMESDEYKDIDEGAGS